MSATFKPSLAPPVAAVFRHAFAAMFGAALIGVLAAPVPAEAAARCPKSGEEPDVSLETKSGRVVYDNSKSRNQLQQLQANSKGASTTRRGWKPIGLTLTELKFHMSISVSTFSRPDDRHCATVEAVEASLGYEKITVYVDKHYRRDSCQHRSVLEHENRHVAIFRGVLDRYGPEVERRLAQSAAGLTPVIADSPQKASSKLQNALQRRMEPLFNKMNRTLDRKNDSLDTAKNYQREQTRCRKW